MTSKEGSETRSGFLFFNKTTLKIFVSSSYITVKAFYLEAGVIHVKSSKIA
jgi:hypothetical protein